MRLTLAGVGSGRVRRTLRRAALAVGGGALLFAGHPPLDYGWAGVVALVPLVALGREVERTRAALGWGLLSGVVFFAPLLLWIQRFGVLPWVLLSLLQAASVAAFVAGVAAWRSRPGRVAMVVVWWVGLEALRTAVPLGGFPWGVLGYTQHDGGPFLPVARAFGVLGVSAALAAVAALIEEALASPRRVRGLALPGVGVLLVVGLCLVVGGAPPEPTGETVDIAAVQGNDIELPPVVDRDDLERVEAVAELQLAATRLLEQAPEGPPAVAVWPENALDSDPRNDPELGAIVGQTLEILQGGSLLAGVLLDGQQEDTFLNTVAQFDASGQIVDVYEKRKLVPFGEYVPWRSVLGDFPPLRAIANDGMPGTEPGVFDVAGAHIGPVTCFESIFPAIVRSQVLAGADVLVVSTNNASFGRTPASAQHLAFSQLRAVETGRWVLHAGISGISAVVDPRGRVTQRTDLFEQTVVRADLPLIEGRTVATRVGEWPGRTALAASALGIAALLVTRRRGLA